MSWSFFNFSAWSLAKASTPKYEVTSSKGSIFALGSAGAAVVALLVSMVAGHEGYRPKAYLDPVGVPTICYGETLNVKLGQKRTKDECNAMLQDSLRKHERDMLACINRPLPPKTQVAFLGFTYNVGAGTFCGKKGKNSIAKRINKGDLVGACKALNLYTSAKGKKLKGLVTRRAAESKLCLEGLNE